MRQRHKVKAHKNAIDEVKAGHLTLFLAICCHQIGALLSAFIILILLSDSLLLLLLFCRCAAIKFSIFPQHIRFRAVFS